MKFYLPLLEENGVEILLKLLSYEVELVDLLTLLDHYVVAPDFDSQDVWGGDFVEVVFLYVRDYSDVVRLTMIRQADQVE